MLDIVRSKNQITLNWSIPAIQSKYQLSYLQNGVWVELSSNIVQDVNTIIIDQLLPSTKYQINGSLFNAANEVIDTLSTEIETFADITISNINVFALEKSVVIDVSTDKKVKYEIYLMPQNTIVESSDKFAFQTKSIIDNLKANTQYSFDIKVIDKNGGYAIQNIQVQTKRNIWSDDILSPLYKLILNYVDNIGISNFIKEWINAIDATVLSTLLQNTPQLSAKDIQNFVVALFDLISTNSSNEAFVRSMAVLFKDDLSKLGISKKQKKAILMVAENICNPNIKIVGETQILELIEDMNNKGLISNNSPYRTLYNTINPNPLDPKPVINYENIVT